MITNLPLLLLALAPADVKWEADYAAALSRAADEVRVVFVAVHSDGEARSEAFWKTVYKDKRVRALAQDTVNLLACLDVGWNKRCSCAKAGDLDLEAAKFVEAAVREELLKANADGVVASPQHLWLDARGDLLLCAPFELDADELAWCFGEAARLAGGERPALEQGRAPRRLLYAEAYQPPAQDEFGRGLRPDELEEKLAALKASGIGGGRGGAGGAGGGMGRLRERLASFVQIAFTDEREAQEHIDLELGSGLVSWAGSEVLANLLHTLGALAPASSWELFEPYADDREPALRNAAAIAFEQLGTPEALRTVKAALKREKDAAVEKNWLRALGAVAREDKGARKLLLDASHDGDALRRRNALFALGWLPQVDEVRARLGEALDAQDGDDARAAVCAMALSRDPAYLPRIAARAAQEGMPEALEAALDAARAVLAGGSLTGIESAVREACRDRLARERVFFRAVPTTVPGGGRGR